MFKILSLKCIKALLACCLLYFAVFLLHYHYYLITFPYPIIYSEGTMMSSTTQLLHGVNPYNFLIEPQYTNNYGIVYPVIVWPLASLFGVNLLVHRAVTGFFILASCLVIFFVIYKKRTPLLLNCWAVLTLYASLLFRLTSTPCVDPASTGLFFMLLTIFIPYFLDYSNVSLLISLICGLLAFYTKAYFFLGLPVMVSYLFFFVSKKKSLYLGVWSLPCLILSVVVINHFFQSYFDDCFFISCNVSALTSMPMVLARQLHAFVGLNKGILLLILLVLIFRLVSWFIAFRKKMNEALKTWGPCIRLKDWDDPLIINRLPLEIYAGICMAIVLIMLMGSHLGSNLWYFFQLFSPFLVIYASGLAGQFTLWPILFSFLLIYNLSSLTHDDNYRYFNKKPIGWNTIEMLVKENNSIFNSPLIAPLLIQENKQIVDNGTQYYTEGGQRQGLIGLLFQEDKRVADAQKLYAGKLQYMVKYKLFDLIIVEMGYSSKTLPGDMLHYYRFVGPILVNLPQDRKYYMMTVWSRIS